MNESKINHAKEALKYCKSVTDGINGLCDILDLSDDFFNESDRLGTYKAISQKIIAWGAQYEDYIFEQEEAIARELCMRRKFEINDFWDRPITVYPQVGLYQVEDLLGRPMHIPAIQIYTEDGEPYATLTKSFGEFIAVKNCAYIDTNNCPYSKKLLELGVAKDTGITKASGFCRYPLWEFDEDFLKDIGGEEYAQYSKEFDDYMSFGEDEDEEPEIDSFEQSM